MYMSVDTILSKLMYISFCIEKVNICICRLIQF
jgi:hypothetical protein